MSPTGVCMEIATIYFISNSKHRVAQNILTHNTESRKRCKNVIKFYFCNWIVFGQLFYLTSLILHVDDISSHVEHLFII